MTPPSPHVPSATDTHHAPAERAPESELKSLAARALADPILTVVLEAMGGLIMVLDGHRQIIGANPELLKLLGVESGGSLVGLRPGEAVRCVNAHREASGCGTSLQCRHCGAVAAILAAQVSRQPVEGQCTITRWKDDCHQVNDFHVRIIPLNLKDGRVFVAVFHDITTVKWQQLQSQMFVHDMANLLTGLSGWSAVLKEEPSAEVASQVVEMVQHLNETLQSQRLLLECESGALKLSNKPVFIDALVADLRGWFESLAEKRNCRFVVVQEPGAFALVTDATLLMRVLGNLAKNALEASEPGETVTVTIRPSDGHTEFLVHNSGIIPELTASQLFKTRFSTKGPGRGLGMYSIQVFGEHYLSGHVDFETSRERGTTFRFTVPNSPPLKVS